MDTDHPDLVRLRKLAHRMDTAFRLPIVGVRVGWDSVLGLVPGIGDVLALAPAGYIVKESYRLGAPPSVLAKMGLNIGIDTAIGAIPVLGDLFDVGWKANTRNVELLHRHVAAQSATKKGDPKAAPYPDSQDSQA
ncbi:DUF4112 domain-containing protein [Sulfitobacter sp. S190]|uniref:DUF4112 domain-containing protein n=1 Tax=Sulfitobacter sp. S190 TaxID=2867022 RepID=UPI0021A93FD7|nr:DUF4112 domain-containing protein [Sulfitobacter sp. S190]UWR23845.1 DUF4112 domain-containing protein [Sulfitobacter sp. S190]